VRSGGRIGKGLELVVPLFLTELVELSSPYRGKAFMVAILRSRDFIKSLIALRP